MVELTTSFTYSIIIIKYITEINIHIHNEHIYLKNTDISVPTKYAIIDILVVPSNVNQYYK